MYVLGYVMHVLYRFGSLRKTGCRASVGMICTICGARRGCCEEVDTAGRCGGLPCWPGQPPTVAVATAAAAAVQAMAVAVAVTVAAAAAVQTVAAI